METARAAEPVQLQLLQARSRHAVTRLPRSHTSALPAASWSTPSSVLPWLSDPRTRQSMSLYCSIPSGATYSISFSLTTAQLMAPGFGSARNACPCIYPTCSRTNHRHRPPALSPVRNAVIEPSSWEAALVSPRASRSPLVLVLAHKCPPIINVARPS